MFRTCWPDVCSEDDCSEDLGKSLVRCLFLKHSKDLVEKIISPVKFDIQYCSKV